MVTRVAAVAERATRAVQGRKVVTVVAMVAREDQEAVGTEAAQGAKATAVDGAVQVSTVERAVLEEALVGQGSWVVVAAAARAGTRRGHLRR